jgi:hypothetical protein
MTTFEMVGIPQRREAVRNFHPVITARPGCHALPAEMIGEGT